MKIRNNFKKKRIYRLFDERINKRVYCIFHEKIDKKKDLSDISWDIG